MVLTIVMSTSVFAAGGDNYGEDIFWNNIFPSNDN